VVEKIGSLTAVSATKRSQINS